MTPDWQPISTVPKYHGKDNVPDRYMVWLYDPDLRKDSRVQPAFWNSNYDGWQILIETNDDPVNPTHWMKYEPPLPPRYAEAPQT
jgi:hypothetical protein